MDRKTENLDHDSVSYKISRLIQNLQNHYLIVIFVFFATVVGLISSIITIIQVLPTKPNLILVPTPTSSPSPTSWPAPDTSASNERLSELRAAAENWQARSTIDYQDFSKVKAAINEEDKKRWNDDDQMAWDQLTVAAQLLNWRNKVFTANDAKELPIDVTVVYSDGVPQNFRESVVAALELQGFKNVQVTDVTKAAILVNLGPATHNCVANPALSLNSGAAMGVCSVTASIAAYWIGGAPLFAATAVRGEQSGKTSDDEAMDTAANISAAKIAKLVASAVIKH